MTTAKPEAAESAEKWHLIIGNIEAGPFTTAALIELARTGELRPEQQVRKSDTETRVVARQLPFLTFLETVSSLTTPPQMTSPKKTPGKPSATMRSNVPREFGPRGRKLFIAACGLLGSIILGGWWSWSPAGFTAQDGDSSQNSRVFVRKAVARPPRPQPPTLANVPRDKRVPLPGFEKIESAFTPTLSADLKIIVFAGPFPQKGYDLFIATRDDVNQPFGRPDHISTCSSEETDAYASLSPDGLELVFVRSDKQPRLWYTIRNSTAEPFAPPEPMVLGDFDSDVTDVYQPHMPTELDVVFMVHSDSASGWDILQATRPSKDVPFGTPRPIPFSDSTPPYRLSPDLLRAYFGWHKGIWMSARGAANELFDPSHSELSTLITGEIEGPIFVSPKEDVFIFCGPETGKPLGESRKLWMVQP